MSIGYYPKQHIKNNVTFFLEEQAKKQPDKVAFYFLPEDSLLSGNFDHDSLTYDNFNKKVGRLAAGLLQVGIKKGKRVVVFAPISTELYLSIAGLQRIGAIPVLLDSLSRKEQMAEILQNSQPSGIIAPSAWLKMFADKLNIFGIKIRISTKGNTAEKGVFQINNLLKGKAQNIVPLCCGSFAT